jgi:anti-sigma B factor antagonist
MPFAVRSRQADGVTVVDVGGEVDIETAPRMRAALAAAIEAGLPVVVDLGAVTFMDSFGFGVLAAAHQQGAGAGAPVLLRAVSDRIRHLLDLLGLDAVLTIEPEPDGQHPDGQRHPDGQPRQN